MEYIIASEGHQLREEKLGISRAISKTSLVIVIVGFLLVVASGATFFYFRSQSTSTTNSESTSIQSTSTFASFQTSSSYTISSSISNMTVCSSFSSQSSQSLNESTGNFIFEINYTKNWNATLEGYIGTSFGGRLALLRCISGNGNLAVSIESWYPIAEVQGCLIATKLDGGAENMTISIGYGALRLSNSTVFPSGSANICIIIAP